MKQYLDEIGANPGRSGHSRSIQAARFVFQARELVAGFFGASDSERVIFTSNGTHALNLVIHGLFGEGDHVIATGMEHNSVIRPIRFLENRRHVTCSLVPCDSRGYPDLDALEKSFRPNTRLVVSTHGSNVSGTIMPIGEMGRRCRERGIPFLVDAAQTAGNLPIDMNDEPIDFLAVTGHKALCGPPGIGCLCLGRHVSVPPFYQGGTGSRSAEEIHPGFLPDSLEAGSLNTVGIAGLKAAIECLVASGLEDKQQREAQLTARLIDSLEKIDGVAVFGPGKESRRLGVVSCTVDGFAPSDVGLLLDRDFGIMTRVGLHCAPLAHRSLGTFPQGTFRLSLGASTTQEEIDLAVDAIDQIARRKRPREGKSK